MSKITRLKRDTPFVQIDKSALQDDRLSWKSKGLLAYLLSLPDDWQIYINELKNHSRDGRDSTRTAMNELIKFGYIHRNFSERKSGQFTGYDYFVSEKPMSEQPKTENPKTVNPTLLIKNKNNKENTNNTINKKTIKRNSDSVPVSCSDSAPLQTNPKKEKEKNSAKKRKKFTVADCVFPEVFENNPLLKQTFLDFAEMRHEMKKGYKTKKGTETKLNSLAKDCDRYGIENVIGAIAFSLESEYLGIFVHDYCKRQKQQQQNEKRNYNNNGQTTSIHEDFARRLKRNLDEEIRTIRNNKMQK